MAATIKDVARHAGLSIATISKYLNGGNVRDENRERIVAAVDVLGYKVNGMARGLKTSRTMTVGVLIPSLGKHILYQHRFRGGKHTAGSWIRHPSFATIGRTPGRNAASWHSCPNARWTAFS